MENNKYFYSLSHFVTTNMLSAVECISSDIAAKVLCSVALKNTVFPEEKDPYKCKINK